MLLFVPFTLATDSWTDVSDGVRLLRRNTADPLRIFAVEANLCTTGGSLRATASGERQDQVSDFAESQGALAAINGDFFSYEDYDTSGLAVGNGASWSTDNTSEGFIAFGQDYAWLSPPAEDWSTLADWMHEAVGGRPQLVIEGVAQAGLDDPSHCESLNPRTAVGLSRDRQTLLMVVVDGRTSSSEGVTCDDLADIMVDLGAWSALNLDGGGSSTLWTEPDGVVNDPSDGSERVVANHLALVVSGGEPAESCDWWQAELWLDAHLLDQGPTDVNGDGRSDLCARASTDFRCVLAGDAGFGDTWTLPELSNTNGYDRDETGGTIRTGDIDGDGLADVCARGTAGVQCWRSNGAGFDAAIVGPVLSDEAGWGDVRYASTLRLADVTGDGRDDICARAGAGVWCYPSTGSGFGERIDGPAWSDASGWDDPEHFGTLRFGDLDGDGDEDVCARANAGMNCSLSDGSGFPTAVGGPTWDDPQGWDQVKYWSTIRLQDVDGNGSGELCGREPGGWRCYAWDGTAWSPPWEGPALADDSGWGDHSNYATIRQADIDGDGDLDLCARANIGMYCWPFQAGAWGESILGPAWSDDSGWDHPQYYSTLRMGDLDGDGMADMCARAAAGIRCARSTGTSFDEATEGPEWSDALGWTASTYFSSIRLGPALPPGGDSGVPDAGDSASRAASVQSSESCGCTTVGNGAAAWLAGLGGCAAFARRKRRFREVPTDINVDPVPVSKKELAQNGRLDMSFQPLMPRCPNRVKPVAMTLLVACAPAEETEVLRSHTRPADHGPADSGVADSGQHGSAPCPAGMAPVTNTCMDQYEAPNVQGSLPLVMYTFLEAGSWCAARAKRLCSDSEWQAACEGGASSAYPYGDVHDPGRCNDDKTWRLYDQDALNRWPSAASSPEIATLEALWEAAGDAAGHVQDLYQGEGGGDNEGCANTFAVFDLVGNVEEWTERADGGAENFHGALKGRYWAESRSCQSTVTTHGDTFRFYEIGFRCCSDPG